LYQSSFLSYNPTTGNPCYTAAVIAICVPAREIANQANIPEPGDGSSLFFSKKKKLMHKGILNNKVSVETR